VYRCPAKRNNLGVNCVVLIFSSIKHSEQKQKRKEDGIVSYYVCKLKKGGGRGG
jgi:hypothetical protein